MDRSAITLKQVVMNSDLQRPRALTIDVQRKIIELLAAGNYLQVACEASGLTYDCFRHWQKRWEQDDPIAQEFADFFKAIKVAVSHGECKALGDVRHGQQGWQSAAWFLERRFPNRWGKQERAPIPPPPKDLTALSDDDLERYRQEIETRARR